MRRKPLKIGDKVKVKLSDGNKHGVVSKIEGDQIAVRRLGKGSLRGFYKDYWYYKHQVYKA